MSDRELHARQLVLVCESLADRDQVFYEVIPAVGLALPELGRVAVPARVEGHHPEVFPQRLRKRLPHRGTEAVGMAQQSQWPVAAPIEQVELDAPLGQVELSVLCLACHGRGF